MQYLLQIFSSTPGRVRRLSESEQKAGSWASTSRSPDARRDRRRTSSSRRDGDDRAREDGRTLTTDGPFAETKEVLGGYYLFEADDLDAAIELAARIPAARMGGAIEVRPVVER